MDYRATRLASETTVLTAWQDRLATPAQPLGLSQTLMQCGDALWPRFALWYRQLQALPRRLRRALQRKLALPLVGVALLLALGQGSLHAATIEVDGTTCTLVDAIIAANADTAWGGCPAGSGADTLVLEPPGSTVTLTEVDNTTYGPTGLPVIRSPITIAGQGGSMRRQPSAPPFRLLAVNGSGNLTLQNVTLTGGMASEGRGGGLYNYNGSVIMESCTISGNTANFGAGLASLGGGYHVGGGENGSATATLLQSTVTGNTATCCGGGVGNLGTVTVELLQSTISSNTAAIRGGGLDNIGANYTRATVTLTESVISGNTARTGGGLANQGNYGFANITLMKSSISGNTATVSGGGVAAENFGLITLNQSAITGNTAPYGGGVSLGYRVPLRLMQSTISGNTATESGGGIWNSGYVEVNLTRSTVTGNTAGTIGGGILNEYNSSSVTLAQSLVAGNMAPTAPEIDSRRGTVTADDFNLFGMNGDAGVVGFTPGPTDLVPSEPLTAILDPVLADHGGPTLTHALVPGSPAIDAIPSGTHGCGTTNYSDQRGTARPQPAGGPCDIGAYEAEVTGQPLGAWVVGFAPRTVVCKNVTTTQEVTISDQAAAWDCEAAGLGVSAGDRVAMRVRGTVAGGATDVGGAVTGLQPSSASCTNLTTGQQVQFRMMRGATAGSCVAAGLVVHPGDLIQMHVQGVAE